MIYFVSYGKNATGGPTLMHQGCRVLCDYGFESSMLYVDIQSLDEVHFKFASFKLNSVIGYSKLNDNDIVIVPEQFSLILNVAHLRCRKIIWWLSVDNFIVSYNFRGIFGFLKKLRIILVEGSRKDIDYIEYSSWDVKSCLTWINERFEMHWVQSEYAREFLLSHGIKSTHVGDYLTREFLNYFETNEPKDDVILYNPRKGSKYVKLLKEANPSLNFVPIENLTADGVKKLLMSAKIYVDFGNHPGQDRIPREAAVCGCIVVVGLRGSAVNDVDVCIPRKYKVDVVHFEPMEVGALLEFVLADYDKAYGDFSDYRKYIYNQEDTFKKDILSAIGTI